MRSTADLPEVSAHFRERWAERARYPLDCDAHARAMWRGGDPIPSEPFGIDGAARVYWDANVALIRSPDLTLRTCLTPRQLLQRAAEGRADE